MRLLLAVTFLCASTAHAGLIRYDFTGELTVPGSVPSVGGFISTGYIIVSERLEPLVPNVDLKLENFLLEFSFHATNGDVIISESGGDSDFETDEPFIVDSDLNIVELNFCGRTSCGPFGTSITVNTVNGQSEWFAQTSSIFFLMAPAPDSDQENGLVPSP